MRLLVDGDEWQGLPVQHMSLLSLWPLLNESSHLGFVTKLRASLADKGVCNPFVVCRASDDEVASTFGHRIGYRGPSPGGVASPVVVVGNQRWHAMRYLVGEDRVDEVDVPVVEVESVKAGLELEQVSRKGFEGLYRHG